ncbi:hypothetical protein DL546_000490 [Coniochaeta pulveracea]|uniref:Uncharacterized protein n=1 Tax=Coniochaeta pulveracea TaxID=177199 RepID=A0A420XVL7_9PEZI|nr:hypothetical protein DL546_000490 [Coniochaeta pulveracea]
MCRHVEFSGCCTRCGGFFTWDDLSQSLSCLEAKNVGYFGGCRRGAMIETHTFDQECPPCAELSNHDEGVEVDTLVLPQPTSDKQKRKGKGKTDGGSGSSKKQRTS